MTTYREELIKNGEIKNILEIGTCRAGSFYLLTKAATQVATLATIDLSIENKKRIRSFARKNQRIVIIEASSSDKSTIEGVKEIFPNGIDFLFIDGDHTYQGIKSDFDNYSTFVKPCGLIGFHDIVEDNLTRYGVYTGHNCGGVPIFWKEIKKKFQHYEFVEDWHQDAMGIGVAKIPIV